MGKRFDKRIAFVRNALNRKLTNNVKLANDWYINNHADKLDMEDALQRFAEWLS